MEKDNKIRLIDVDTLLNSMDDRYKEKESIVPNNLAEGFMQMEKLIKEQEVVLELEKENRDLIVQLPCKIGDIVYKPNCVKVKNSFGKIIYFHKAYIKKKVVGFEIKENNEIEIITNVFNNETEIGEERFSVSDIGKTIFLKKEL